MVKESTPFAKYPALLALEKRHEVDIGHAYNTPNSAKSFSGFIATSQRHGFLESLSSGSHFFSLLMGGTTDAGNQEDELIVIVYYSRDKVMQEIIPRIRYLSLHSRKKELVVFYNALAKL